MGGQNCDGCRSWEEDIYWSHFQFHHFMQFLRVDFHQHLALPKTFSDNLKRKLPENVTLKGPGGVVWNIGLTTGDDTLYLAHGWEQFVKDHCLKENDFLVFKYNGESQFDVLIFDGGSLCEKAGSYFVRKCGHTEIEHVGGSLNKKRDSHNNSLEEGNIPSNVRVECALHEKPVHVNGTEKPIDVPPETPPTEKIFNGGASVAVEQYTSDGGVTLAAVPSETANGKRIRNIVSAVKHVQTKRRGRPAKVHNVRERTLDWVTAIEASESVSATRSGTYDELYESNRRPVTEDETKMTEALAKAACTDDDSICVVMKPSHVYKRFYVSMRGTWIGKHISPTSQDVILRLGKGEWIARYSYNNIRNNGGLTGGWKHFALDNNLEVGDACVFKAAGQMNNTFVIEMTIFRVVQEIIPLTPVFRGTKTGTRSGTGRRGRRSAMKKSIQTET